MAIPQRPIPSSQGWHHTPFTLPVATPPVSCVFILSPKGHSRLQRAEVFLLFFSCPMEKKISLMSTPGIAVLFKNHWVSFELRNTKSDICLCFYFPLCIDCWRAQGQGRGLHLAGALYSTGSIFCIQISPIFILLIFRTFICNPALSTF